MNLDQWLADVITELETPVGITLKTDFKASVDIATDPSLMLRVVINVYDNACQAMLPDKAIETNDAQKHTIFVTTQVNNGTAEIITRDTGGGLAPDVLTHVFEPLFCTKGFGVGLGLPIVKQIMEQHHGSVSISNQRRGAQVVLKLPVT